MRGNVTVAIAAHEVRITSEFSFQPVAYESFFADSLPYCAVDRAVAAI